MNTQATMNTENKSRVREALETAGKIAEVGLDVGVLKKRLETAVEEAVVEAERFAKHSRHTIEDAVEDTTYWIKKNPWQSVGYAVGAGLFVGALGGWLLSRRGNNVN